MQSPEEAELSEEDKAYRDRINQLRGVDRHDLIGMIIELQDEVIRLKQLNNHK